jgi:hypothetical protein
MAGDFDLKPTGRVNPPEDHELFCGICSWTCSRAHLTTIPDEKSI